VNVGEFAVASFSEIGRRDENEDRCGEIRSAAGGVRVWAVADGLGGHDGGEIASAAAVSAALASVESADASAPLVAIVRACFEAANAAVVAARAERAHSEMATTLALVASDGTRVAWGHTGDTRIYRLRGERVERLTTDHTVAESMRALSGGSRRATLPEHSNRLLAVLGESSALFDIADDVALEAGDAFLLCSDGVWAHFSERDLAREALAASDIDGWLERLRERVAERADPAQDNATALAFIAGDGRFETRKDPGFLRRILGR
jgi:serine/threonine protein phosphatase PrpC